MKSLTPEQRAAGKQAFYNEMMDNAESRRDFLKKSVLAGAVTGAGLGAFYFGYERTLAKPLRVAIFGTGDEGNVLLGALNPDFHEVRAIADIRPYNQYRAFHGDMFGEVAMKARPGLMAKYGWKTEEEARKHVKVYQHYQDLLDSEKDIEAVIIALPLHLHAPAAVAALKAGKHVITEKLMAHSVHECKEMARIAKTNGLILAVGHQRHYNILYENAKDTIRRGQLGDIHYIQAQWHRGNMPGNDSWSQPLPPGAKEGDLATKKMLKELEAWQRELAETKKATEIELLKLKIAQREKQISDEVLLKGNGQYKSAKDYGYQDEVIKNSKGDTVYERPAIEELIRWRLWDRTGAGLMAELGSHQLDASSIFISAALNQAHAHPLSVTAVGNRPIFGPDRDCEDHVYCIFEFPAPGYNPKDPIDSRKKIAVVYSSINGNGYGGYGETVYGTKGTLILEREQEALIIKESEGASTVGVKKGAALDTQASGVQAAAVGLAATSNVSRGYAEELEHWAWCIRNPAPENQPRCRAEVAMGDAIIALTANMAARNDDKTGRPPTHIEFKESWFDVDSDDTPENVKPDVSRYA